MGADTESFSSAAKNRKCTDMGQEDQRLRRSEGGGDIGHGFARKQRIIFQRS
jgi:hypothetical protein